MVGLNISLRFIFKPSYSPHFANTNVVVHFENRIKSIRNMNFVNDSVLIPLLVGPIFIVAGLIMIKFPPKKINGLYGYRTPSSMKNQERWDFAQRYSANEMIKLGGLLLLSSSVGLIFQPSSSISAVIGLGFTIIVVVILIVRVERAIKNRFENSN
jgi:hypothetical protein